MQRPDTAALGEAHVVERMPVARGEYPRAALPRRRDPGVQRRNHRVAIGYGQCPAWAEVALHVNQQQRVADRQLDSHTYPWPAGLRVMFRIARSAPGAGGIRAVVMAGVDGFEPPLHGPEPCVLPLDDTPKSGRLGPDSTLPPEPSPNSISPACGGWRFDIIRARILAANPLNQRSPYCLDLASDAPTSPPHHNPASGATMSP